MYNIIPGGLFEGRYSVVRMFAQDDTCTVFEADDGGRRGVVRVFRDEQWRGRYGWQRFQTDMGPAAKLNHPNIAAIVDMGQRLEGGESYLVREWLDRRSLEVFITEVGGFEDSDVIDVLRTALSALAQAHSAEVVHGNLNPSNLFIERLPNHHLDAILVDFAVGAKLDPFTPPSVSSGYSAPELEKWGMATAATDLYSLGIIAIEMKVGQRVFPHGQGSGRSPQLPPDLLGNALFRTLLANLIEPEPRNRPASAAIALATLNRLGGDTFDSPTGEISQVHEVYEITENQPTVALEALTPHPPTRVTADFEALSPDFEALSPDFEALSPDFEASSLDFEALSLDFEALSLEDKDPLEPELWSDEADETPPSRSMVPLVLVLLLLLAAAGAGLALIDPFGWFEATSSQAKSDSDESASNAQSETPTANGAGEVEANVGSPSDSTNPGEFEGALAAPTAAAGHAVDRSAVSAAAKLPVPTLPPTQEAATEPIPGETTQVMTADVDTPGTGSMAGAGAVVGQQPSAGRAVFTPVGPGDPLFTLCSSGEFRVCAMAEIQAGGSLILSEADLGLEGAGLSLVERVRPFSLTASKRGEVRIAVPESTLWALVELESNSGPSLVLVHTDRVQTRKTLSLFERTARSDGATQARGLIAQQIELTGDSVPEVVIQGFTNNEKGGKEPLTVIATNDGGRALASFALGPPEVSLSAVGSQPVLVLGAQGCDRSGRLRLLRYDGKDEQPLFDSNNLASLAVVPSRFKKAGERLRIVLSQEAGEVTRADLFVSASKCLESADGLALTWSPAGWSVPTESATP